MGKDVERYSLYNTRLRCAAFSELLFGHPCQPLCVALVYLLGLSVLVPSRAYVCFCLCTRSHSWCLHASERASISAPPPPTRILGPGAFKGFY